MVLNDIGLSGAALNLTPSGVSPSYCAIGDGSGAEDVTIGSLTNEVLAARKVFSNRDIAVVNQTTWTFDYGSTTMSGIDLREFGLGTGSEVDAQDLWTRDGFNPITFNGENELQTQITLKTSR